MERPAIPSSGTGPHCQGIVTIWSESYTQTSRWGVVGIRQSTIANGAQVTTTTVVPAAGPLSQVSAEIDGAASSDRVFSTLSSLSY
jgi:hypothetical protein